MADTAVREFLHNLRLLPQTFKEAWLRLGKVPESEREESQATFHNFFLHIHSVRVHLRTLSPTLTWGLGLAAPPSFVTLTLPRSPAGGSRCCCGGSSSPGRGVFPPPATRSRASSTG